MLHHEVGQEFVCGETMRRRIDHTSFGASADDERIHRFAPRVGESVLRAFCCQPDAKTFRESPHVEQHSTQNEDLEALAKRPLAARSLCHGASLLSRGHRRVEQRWPPGRFALRLRSSSDHARDRTMDVIIPLDVKTLLASVEAAPPIDAAEVVAAALTDALGARDVSFLIADYSGRALIRLSHVHREDSDDEDINRERGHSVPLAGTPHGRALAEQEIQVVPADGRFRVFAPVTTRGEAVGVLALGFDDEPDAQTLATVSAGAHALAYIVIANRRFTDLFEWGQRSVPLSLEAEIQHRLLPASYTCEGGQFTLAGWMEPSGDVGGDTFDFSVERDTLHLSMTDAMGHTLNAAVLATVLVGALRNARRRGVDLAEQSRLANEALCGFSDEGDFVTGQVVRIDNLSGTARIVNAGHPLPILIRDGRAENVALAPALPFGIAADTEYAIQELVLQPGDRLAFLTDGMLERNAADVNAMEILTQTRHLHPREAVQALTGAVVKACGGVLRDDATVLCVDWRGGPTGERDASSGADQ